MCGCFMGKELAKRVGEGGGVVNGGMALSVHNWNEPGVSNGEVGCVNCVWGWVEEFSRHGKCGSTENW